MPCPAAFGRLGAPVWLGYGKPNSLTFVRLPPIASGPSRGFAAFPGLSSQPTTRPDIPVSRCAGLKAC